MIFTILPLQNIRREKLVFDTHATPESLGEISQSLEAGGSKMENAVVLREWFDRVDAGRTGNITAPQLQVRFQVPSHPRLRSFFPPILFYPYQLPLARGADC